MSIMSWLQEASSSCFRAGSVISRAWRAPGRGGQGLPGDQERHDGLVRFELWGPSWNILLSDLAARLEVILTCCPSAIQPRQSAPSLVSLSGHGRRRGEDPAAAREQCPEIQAFPRRCATPASPTARRTPWIGRIPARTGLAAQGGRSQPPRCRRAVLAAGPCDDSAEFPGRRASETLPAVRLASSTVAPLTWIGNPYPLASHREELLETRDVRMHRVHAWVDREASERCQTQVACASTCRGRTSTWSVQPLSWPAVREPRYYARGIAGPHRTGWFGQHARRFVILPEKGIDLEGMDWASCCSHGWWLKTSTDKHRPAREISAWCRWEFPSARPVLVVAGGSAKSPSSTREVRHPLAAQASFRGRSSPAGRVRACWRRREVQASSPSGVETIGYLPAADVVDDVIDRRYTHSATRTGVPAQHWRACRIGRIFWSRVSSLVRCGCSASTAAESVPCEYAVAAAFGALVGIVEGAPRGGGVPRDPLWTEPVQERTASGQRHRRGREPRRQLRQAGGSRRLRNIEALPARWDA